MKRFTILIAAAVMLLAILLQPVRLWGQEKGFTAVYTLTPETNSASASTAYNSGYDFEINNITWNVTGNTGVNPWRIGGKKSTIGTNGTGDRPLYSKNAISDNISKIVISHGNSSSNITVNSITLIVSTAQDGGGTVISTLTGSYTNNTTTTFERPADKNWSGKYYKIVYNVTNTTTTQKFVLFSEAVFYKTTYTLTYSATNGSIAGVDANEDEVESGASIGVGETVTLTATPATGYSFSSWEVDGTESTLSSTSENPTTFTMGTANATVTATFVSAGNYITVTPTEANVTTSAQNIVFNVDTDQSLTASSVQFYTAASGGTETSKPDWIGTIAYDGSSSPKTLTVPVTENTGVARHAYFTLKNGSIESSRVTINQAAITVATPEFDEDEGTYFEDLLVDITCDTDGATIYYTTDGSTPAANNGTEYDGNGVSIEEGETTLKAIAIKNNVSSPVASATYTVMYPLTTMEAIYAAATYAGSTATDTYITLGNWVISGVSTDEKSAYVTDGSGKGFIAYNGSKPGFAVGNVLSNTVHAYLKLYNGAAEFTNLTTGTSGIGVTTGGTVTPITNKTIADLSGVCTGGVYKLSGLTYSSSTQLLSDGVNTIKPYNQLYGDMSFVDGETYNVTGVYLQYNSTKEILPRSSADIVEVHDPAITTSPATSLSVPNYIKGTHESGIDTEILTVNGANLTADVTVALENGASSDFEMSTDLETWGHSITLNQSNGSVTNAEIAVRLKVGESVADYSDRIVLSSTNATTKYVNVTGSVTYAVLTYNGNGEGVSNVPAAVVNCTYEQSVVVSGVGSMTRDGYTFSDWNTVYDGSGTHYGPSTVNTNITITENTTLYAQWVPKTYDITKNAMTHGDLSFTVGVTPNVTQAQTDQTVTIVPNPDEGYSLGSVSVNNGAVTVTNNTFVMPASAVTVSATFVPTAVDEITSSTLNISGTSYTTWTNKTFSSEAVYAGCSYPTTKIQLKSKDNVSGIVTTTSGGKVKKVKVIWDSGSGTLDVYGRNSAYSDASDLYNDATDGSKLGGIDYTSSASGAELVINNDTVTHIGLRSKAGTVYISKIEITWAAPTHALSYDANGGTGTMTDPSSPYKYNASVTVLEKANTITAPSGKMFARWDTNAEGNGTSYAPGDIFSMPKNDMTLYAIWEEECNETATMAATSGTKEYVNDAGELSFKINLSSKVTALSGCAAITEYGFVYSTNGTTPTVGGANCTKIVKGTEYTTANTVFEHELTTATLGATYKICSYATNLAGTAYGTEATVPIDDDYPSYTISYSTNGTAEGSTTKIYQGNAISDLITPANVPAGYTFRGWYGGDYALNNSAPTFVKNGDAISGNLTLKAVFAIGTTSEGEFTKSYGFETADDDWTIDGPARDNTNPNTGSYAGKINTNNTYVTFNNKVKVKEFSFAFTRASNNNNYNVYIETKTDNTAWAAAETYAMSGFNDDGTYKTKTKTFDGTTELYVRFHCSNTTAVRYVDDVTITYDAEYTTYSNYCTSVSPQTAISGTITAGHLTTNGTIASDAAVYITTPLTINSNVTLTVNGVLANDNPANLIIEDGGQIIFNTENSMNSVVAATVKKETYAATAKDAKTDYYWYAISSAVANPSISSATNIASGTYDLYRYNEAATATNAQGQILYWENYKAHNSGAGADFTALEKGRGYIYRNAADLSIEMTGEVNVEDFNYAVTKTGSGVLAGFNLIGNPYSHDIYKGAGTAIPNGSGLLRTGFYYMEPTTGKWTIGTDGYTAIKPNQGILVQTDATGDIAMTNTTASAAKYNNDNIMFKVANSQYSDEAYAWFDKGRGLNKISHRNAEVPMLYINQDGEDYAIATMSDDTKMFSLNFKAMTMGKYTLSYKTKGEFNYLHVIDRFTGEDVDMLLEGEYSFVASPSDSDARFIVKLAYLPDYSDGEGDIFAYQNGSDIFVSGEGELQIFDVMGRFVMSERINGVKTISADELSKGVYVLRLVGNGMKTQKIVVK